MPVKITKKNGRYQVKTPNMVHAKGTTMAKAKAQMRLLQGIEHGFVPDKNMVKHRRYTGSGMA